MKLDFTFELGGNMNSKVSLAKAIFTDSQFWVPTAVLAIGIALLILLH
jgi:hypothetical protein